MKRTFRIAGLCALMALAAVSCKKSEQNKGTMTFRANIAQLNGNAKTHIGDGNMLVWNAGDSIKVYTLDKSEDNAAVFTTTADNVTAADFSGELEESEVYYAFYPVSSVSSDGDKFSLAVAAQQDYAGNDIASGTYPMWAASTDGDFNFSSHCGLLAIPMKGTATVGSIVLTDSTGMKLAGHYEMNDTDTTFVGTGNNVTLTFGSAGHMLDASRVDTMYFVLPAGVFSNGFTAEVRDTEGNSIKTFGTSNNNVIERETIRIMNPAVTVEKVTTNSPTTDATNPGTFTLHGEYEVSAGVTVSEVGFYYGVEGSFDTRGTIKRVVATSVTGTSFSYVVPADELEENTTYEYRAFMVTSVGETLGNLVEFSTYDYVYVVYTESSAQASTSPISFTINGSYMVVVNTGGSSKGINPDELGFYWGTDATSLTDRVVSTSVSGAQFEYTLTDLEGGKTYYYQAFLQKDGVDTRADEVKSFSVDAPTVTTGTAAATSTTAATGHVTLTSTGSGEVTEIGLCWGTESDPTVSTTTSNHAAASGHAVNTEYTVDFDGLTEATTYNVRAYAKVGSHYYYGSNVSFATPTPTYAVTTDTAMLVSPSPISFTLHGSYSVSYSKDVTVGFYYGPGADMTSNVTATPGTSFSYTLDNLAKNTVYSYQAYIIEGGTEHKGAIKTFRTPDPRFTVNVAEGRQVYLASGNLQYQPSTHTWRFAENPWNFVGGLVGSNDYGNVYEGGVKCRNNYISDTYSGWIDLFGWGTKNNPTETNNNFDDDDYTLYTEVYSTTFSDWGDNIEPGMHWRTLKGDEWACMMGKTSAAASRTTYGYFGGVEQVNARYAMVTLEGFTGVILFPDVYYHPAGVAVPQSFGDASTSAQTAYTQAEWNQMAANGAIFLPTQTGYRSGTAYVSGVNNSYYWTSTYYTSYKAWRVTITSTQINASHTAELLYGYSVRLARNAE